MGTAVHIKRALMARIEGISALEVVTTSSCTVTIRVVAKPEIDRNRLSERIRSVLSMVGAPGVTYVVTYDSLGPHVGSNLEGRFSLGALDGDTSLEGMMRALLTLVPSLGRVVAESGSAPDFVRLYVGCADGSATPKV